MNSKIEHQATLLHYTEERWPTSRRARALDKRSRHRIVNTNGGRPLITPITQIQNQSAWERRHVSGILSSDLCTLNIA
jgi:hypothetical protein